MKILSTGADIYVNQECEDSAQTKHAAYQQFAENYYWTGENKNKGLGVFAKPEIQLKNNEWDTGGHKCFLSLNINEQFNLLAMWVAKPYIKGIPVINNILKFPFMFHLVLS